MEDEEVPATEKVFTPSEVTRNKSYEDTLIEAFKNREERAFWAMVIIGLTIVKPEFHNIWIFGFLAIFGAFQLNYMYLLREMARGQSAGKLPLSIKKAGISGENSILSDVRSGVVGNGAWWILGLVALFLWTQTGLKDKVFNNSKTQSEVVEQGVVNENVEMGLEVPNNNITEQEKP